MNEQTIAGFGDPAVVYIAALFVVTEALDATRRAPVRRLPEARVATVAAVRAVATLLVPVIRRFSLDR